MKRYVRWLLPVGLATALGASGPRGAAVIAAPAYFPLDLSKRVTQRLSQPMLNHEGNDLAELEAELAKESRTKTLKDVPFRIDGAILVGPGETEGRFTGGPVKVVQSVKGIPVGRKAERLYFLHAAHFGSQMEGAKIGAYIVHYEDGKEAEIPIRDKVDLADWWDAGDEVSEGEVAWRGKNEATKQLDPQASIRLFMAKWKNPRPEVSIKSLDMVTGEQKSGQSAAVPFLVALTVSAPAEGDEKK
jgi:hypothetical protein